MSVSIDRHRRYREENKGNRVYVCWDRENEIIKFGCATTHLRSYLSQRGRQCHLPLALQHLGGVDLKEALWFSAECDSPREMTMLEKRVHHYVRDRFHTVGGDNPDIEWYHNDERLMANFARRLRDWGFEKA